MTFSKKYDLAMTLVDQGDADRYFERLVQDTMTSLGKTREEAEQIERSNLGYYAGYHLDETRERVERLFRCAHPVFGSIAENGPATLEQIREQSPYLDAGDGVTGMTEPSADPRYEALPQPIRSAYSEREYTWLTDAEKARLVTVECEPEWKE